jgi:hypothetical protein
MKKIMSTISIRFRQRSERRMEQTIMYCYIRYGGIEASKFSTSVPATGAVWDAKKQCFTGYSVLAAKLNEDLKLVYDGVFAIYKRFEYEKQRHSGFITPSHYTIYTLIRNWKD